MGPSAIVFKGYMGNERQLFVVVSNHLVLEV